MSFREDDDNTIARMETEEIINDPNRKHYNNFDEIIEDLNSDDEDPFYSEANMNRLRKIIADVESGKAKLIEHELIECEDE